MSLRSSFSRRLASLAITLAAVAPLMTQERPETPSPTPEITNRNLDQFKPATQGVTNGAVPFAAPPGSTGPALDLPADLGAHPAAPRERWVLKVALQDGSGRWIPFQISFLSRALGGDGTAASWSRSRMLSAQAVLALEEGKVLLSGTRRARLGIAAAAAEDRVSLRCDGWSLTDPGDGRLHLEIPLTGGRVRMTLAYQGDPLSLPALGPGDPIRRTLRVRLEAQGRLEVDGRIPIPVQGRAVLLQEWGPDVPQEVLGWDHAFLLFRDGRTLTYLASRIAPGAGPSLLLETNPQGRPSRVHRPPAPKSRRAWVSPFSRARYPVAVQILDPRQALTFEPMMEDQEWQGDWVGASAMWSGFGRVKDPQGALLGEGFLELAGYAHPVQGRY